MNGVEHGDAGSYSYYRDAKGKKKNQGGYFHPWGFKHAKKSNKQAKRRKEMADHYRKKKSTVDS